MDWTWTDPWCTRVGLKFHASVEGCSGGVPARLLAGFPRNTDHKEWKFHSKQGPMMEHYKWHLTCSKLIHVNQFAGLQSKTIMRVADLKVSQGLLFYYSAFTLSWQFIINSSVEFASTWSVEFLTCMASKTLSHVNLHVQPGANKGCWMC